MKENSQPWFVGYRTHNLAKPNFYSWKPNLFSGSEPVMQPFTVCHFIWIFIETAFVGNLWPCMSIKDMTKRSYPAIKSLSNWLNSKPKISLSVIQVDGEVIEKPMAEWDNK